MVPSTAKPTILVVEDDRDLREMYRAALTGAGFTVAAVEDGIDALRQIEQRPPKLIVLDLALPRLSGYDVQRELAARAETRDIPIVVVTGTDPRTVNRASFDCVLAKPVNVDALVAAVDICLRTARRSRSFLASAARDPGMGDAASVRKARASETPRRVRTILVVDDEVMVQMLLRHFLEEKGFRVTTAGSVGQAISILEDEGIDAVVLDVRMPRRSGLELLEFIRYDPMLHAVPVLILTGADLTPDEEATIARGSGYVFYKTDNLESLATHLDQLT